MTRLSQFDRDQLELAFYLPMVLTVLNRDRSILEASSLKLPNPYLTLIEETMKAVQRDLKKVRDYMREHQMKVEKLRSDDTFTSYLFLFRGYEEEHNYFNPRIRNKVEQLLREFLLHRSLPSITVKDETGS